MRVVLFRLILLSLVGFWSSFAAAQNYPIQAGVALAPPYSPQLSSWKTESERVAITLLNKDFLTPQVDVHLSLLIEGPGITIRTRTGYVSTSVFTLSAGVPYLLSGSDIPDLLDPINLDFQGLDKAAFTRSGQVLPEGIWRVTVTAFNTTRNLQVSNAASATAALFKHAPPLLNLPLNNAAVSADMPQNVNFQWTPRHTISPGLQGNVRYRLRLVELYPASREPNEAFQSTLTPFFETLTDQTFYSYSPSDPPLIPGRAYAWQVQVIDVNGADLFENDGYSQIYSFVWGDDCPVPESFQVHALEGRSFEATWDSSGYESSYILRYRIQNQTEWKTEIVSGDKGLVSSLQANTIYEVQLSRLCAAGESKPTQLLTLRTDSFTGVWSQLAAKSCGKPALKFDLSNPRVLPVLMMGDRIKAADFTVTVLSATGSNGVFSGSGTVLLPFTGKIPIPCTWENITINSDYRLVQGKISILRKPLVLSNLLVDKLADRWRDLFGDNWNHSNPRGYSGSITNISPTGDGRIRITGSSGDEYFFTGRNTVITDKNGQRWFVSSGGAVTGPEGQREKPIVTDERSGEGTPGSLLPMGPVVYFSASETNRLAWDAFDIRQQTGGSTYDKLDGPAGGYMAAWKLLQTAQKETIIATVRKGTLAIPKDSIRFLRSDGTMIPAMPLTDSTWNLEMTGRFHLWADAVWATAVMPGTTTRRILGKLNLISTDERKVHIVLASVSGQGGVVDASQMQSALNQITGKFGVKTTVSFKAVGAVNGYNPATNRIAVNRNLLDVAYGPDLQRFVNTWEQSHASAGKDTAVMFLLGAAADDTKGYMALNSRYGFIFCGNSPPQAHTIAHEIGHGLLVLEHPFEEDETSARKSLNLMDYSAPYAMTHWAQWKRIFDKDEVSSYLYNLRQKKGKGKLITVLGRDLEFFRNPDSTFTFITPAGYYIKLPASTTNVNISTFDKLPWLADQSFIPRTLNLPFGSLISFGGEKFGYRVQCNKEGSFSGYLKDETTHDYYYHKTFKIDSTTHLGAGGVAFIYNNGSGFVNQLAKVKCANAASGTPNYIRSDLNISGSPTVLPISDSADYNLNISDLLAKYGSGAVQQSAETLSLQAYLSDTIEYDGIAYSLQSFLPKMLAQTASLRDYIAVFAYMNISREQMRTLQQCVTDRKLWQTETFYRIRRKGGIEKYFTRQQYYLDAMDAFRSAAAASDVLIKLKQLVKRSADAASFDSVFHSSKYMPCQLAGLGPNERIYIIKTIGEDKDNWYHNGKNFLLDLLETCPAEDISTLYSSGFRANKYAWLRNIWGEDEEVLEDWARKQVFFKYLELFTAEEAKDEMRRSISNDMYMAETGWKFYNYPSGVKTFYLGLDEGSEKNIRGQYVTGLSSDSAYSNLLVIGRVYLFQYVKQSRYSSTTAVLSAKGTSTVFDQWTERTYSDSMWPLEPMNVLPCGDGETSEAFQKGELISMPAILVHYLERQRLKKIEEKAFREKRDKVIKVVVIAASVATIAYTGGLSLAATAASEIFAGLAVHHIDAEVESTWKLLSAVEKNKYSAGYNAWKRLVLVTDVYLLRDIPRLAASGLKNLAGIAKYNREFGNFVQSGKPLFQGIKSRSIGTQAALMSGRMEKYVAWGHKIVPSHVSEIKHLLATEKNKAFFWSGRTNGIGGETKALEIAKSQGGITLEGWLLERNIELPPWNPSDPKVVKLWEDVSAEFAAQASGEIRVVLGQQLRPGNVWETKELPILLSNKKVTKITSIDPETLIEKVIFIR